MQRFARATREALYAMPFLVVLGWLGPYIYGYRVTLPRALCAVVAVAAAEMLIDEAQPTFQRELQVLAFGLGISVGLACLIQMVWPGSV